MAPLAKGADCRPGAAVTFPAGARVGLMQAYRSGTGRIPAMDYALTSLAFTALFGGCAHLLGLGVLAWVGPGPARGGPPPGLLAIPTGTGLLALMLFVLAAFGALRPHWILAALTPVLGVAAYAWLRTAPAGGARLPSWPDSAWLRITAGLLALTALLLAMSAPLEWDELAYHLPYARDYANAGGLVVSERLRFPLQPHNFQLLYAAALQFAHEPAAHLVNALAGSMVAAGVFAFARSQFGQGTAVLAAVMFVAFAGSLFDTALVDLGLAMFVFYAFYALAIWQRDRAGRLLTLAAFLLAMAAGTKYQGLAQVPGFALALVVAARPAWLRPAMQAGALFLLFAGGWYLRNWLISGDPVHPLGAGLFGHWLWDAQDLAGQVGDVERYRDHLPFELIPALGFLVLRERRDPVTVSLLIVALTGLAAWYLGARYDRYLLPTYPLLAILSARVIVVVGRRLTPRRLAAALVGAGHRASAVRTGLALVLVTAVLVRTIEAKWPETCFTETCVERVHAERLASVAAARTVDGFDRLKLYQLGLENELYVMGDRAAGDWFGPYRYREVLALAGDSGALRRHLQGLGRDSLLINRERPPFDEFSRGFAGGPGFDKVYEDQRVTLYRIVPEE